MTKIIDKPLSAKHLAFINAWLINGHIAGQAYKKAYPNCKSGYDQNGLRLLRNDKIQAEIQRRTAKLAKKADWTIEKAQEKLEELIQQSIDQRQPAAGISGVVAINRMYGMDKDNNAKESTVIVINPPKQAKSVDNEVIENE
jgi:hypothetical protein